MWVFFLKSHLKMASQAFINAPDPKRPSSGGFTYLGDCQIQGCLPKQTDTPGTGHKLCDQKQNYFLNQPFGCHRFSSLTKELLTLSEGNLALSAKWLSLLPGAIPSSTLKWRVKLLMMF